MTNVYTYNFKAYLLVLKYYYCDILVHNIFIQRFIKRLIVRTLHSVIFIEYSYLDMNLKSNLYAF